MINIKLELEFLQSLINNPEFWVEQDLTKKLVKQLEIPPEEIVPFLERLVGNEYIDTDFCYIRITEKGRKYYEKRKEHLKKYGR